MAVAAEKYVSGQEKAGRTIDELKKEVAELEASLEGKGEADRKAKGVEREAAEARAEVEEMKIQVGVLLFRVGRSLAGSLCPV